MVILKRYATGASILGASMLAANIGFNWLAFLVMASGSIAFLVAFWNTEKELIVLNSAFLIINLAGLWRAF